MKSISVKPLFEDGDKEKWKEEVDLLVQEVVEDIVIPGKRCVQGKWSVFTNPDLVRLILSFAHLRSFNYSTEDIPYTLVLNTSWQNEKRVKRNVVPILRRNLGETSFVEHMTFRGEDTSLHDYFSWERKGHIMTVPVVELLRYGLRSLKLDSAPRFYDYAMVTFCVSFAFNTIFGIEYFKNPNTFDLYAHHEFPWSTFYAIFKLVNNKWQVESVSVYGGYDHDPYYAEAVMQEEGDPLIQLVKDEKFERMVNF